MIYSHRYIGKRAQINQTIGRSIKPISQQVPLLVICQIDSFLTYTVEKLLKLSSIPCDIKILKPSQLGKDHKIVNHRVPLFVFSNKMLQNYQILEFLCDLSFADTVHNRLLEQNQSSQLLEFISRKTASIRMAETWGRILQFQKQHKHSGFFQLKDQGIRSEEDYKNYVFQELQNLSIKFKGGILKQSFSHYSAQSPCLQNLLLIDIINSIFRDARNSYPYFYLLSYFKELITAKEAIEQQIQKSLPILRQRNAEVLLDEPLRQSEIQWPRLNINRNKFLITLGITAVAYYSFVAND